MNYIVYETIDGKRKRIVRIFPTQDRAEILARDLNREAVRTGSESRFVVREGVN
jgi:hypothetical protein